MRAVLLPCVLAAALAAGEDEAVRVVLADGAQLERHWNESLLGRVWAEPGLAPLRLRVEVWRELTKREIGIDPVSAVRAARGMQLRLCGLQGGQPDGAVQADLGPQAPQLARRLAATAASVRPLDVSGADEAWSLGARSLARFGGIVGFGRPAELLPLPPAAAEGDLAVRLGFAGLLGMLRSALDPALATQAGALHDLLAQRWRSLDLRATLAADGVAWSGRFAGDVSGLRPIDRALLVRLPATVTAVELVGCDGAAWWRAWGDGLIAALDPLLHGSQMHDSAATLRDVQSVLAGIGIDADPAALVQGLVGTVALVQTPGVPFPGFTILVPRSPALDALVAGVCARLGCRMPEEGGFALLPIRDVPLAIQLARDRGHWLIGTDALFASTWGGGTAGGFEQTALAAGLAQAPAAACVLGAMDLAPTLRLALGYLRQADARILDAAESQAAIVGVARLAALLPPGFHWGECTAQGLELQGRGGDLLGLALPVAVAAVAVPTLLKDRVAANEAIAATTLRSGIFPCQVQFQAGCYQDADGDNVGEYALLSELSGRRATAKVEAGALHLLVGPLAQGDSANGYRYAGHLPDGAGGALGEPDGPGPRPAAAAVDDQERFWVVYAWPRTPESGRRMFAVDQAGQVYVQPWDGGVPAWNALYGGGPWGGRPTWERYRR